MLFVRRMSIEALRNVIRAHEDDDFLYLSHFRGNSNSNQPSRTFASFKADYSLLDDIYEAMGQNYEVELLFEANEKFAIEGRGSYELADGTRIAAKEYYWRTTAIWKIVEIRYWNGFTYSSKH